MSIRTMILAAMLASGALAQAPAPQYAGAPATVALPPLPADVMTNPAALPGLLGVPYTLTDGGRCAMATSGGVNVKICIAPPPAAQDAPAEPGDTAPGKPDVALAPVTVQPGDTLGEIARQAIHLAVSMGLISPPGPSLWGPGGLVDLLARHNSIENPSLIFPGQVIDVSIDGLGAAPRPATPHVPAPPPAPADPAADTSFPPFAFNPAGIPMPPPGPGLPPPPALPPVLAPMPSE